MRKAELDYAVKMLADFDWINKRNLFLFGSGTVGLAVAHYEGNTFSGHLIEGWGCRGPNPIFDGIRTPPDVRVFTTASKNAPFLRRNEGFSIDCETSIKERENSVSIVLDRPAHQVSWHPRSYKAMIRFLMLNMNIDIDVISEDNPEILTSSPKEIHLIKKWSHTAVYETAKRHCSNYNRQSRQTVRISQWITPICF